MALATKRWVNGRIEDMARPTPLRRIEASGASIEGDKEVFAAVRLREYDSDGEIVAVGDETSPLAAGHSLRPTYDGFATKTDGATQYQALTWNGTAWVADWIRWP